VLPGSALLGVIQETTQTYPETTQTKASLPGGLSVRVVTRRTGSLPNLQYTRIRVGRQGAQETYADA
jgi:hypothetical protein